MIVVDEEILQHLRSQQPFQNAYRNSNKYGMVMVVVVVTDLGVVVIL